MHNSSDKTNGNSNITHIDRALRYSADEVFSSANTSLIINDRDVAIYDFSKSGISCYLPIEDIGIDLGISSFSDHDGSDLMEGKNASIVFKVNDFIAFQGEGQIVRRENFPKGKKLAVKLLNNDINISEII